MLIDLWSLTYSSVFRTLGGFAWNSSDTIESREELPIWYSTPLICCKRRQIQTQYQRAPEIFARELKLWTFSGARIYLIDTKEISLNWHFFLGFLVITFSHLIDTLANWHLKSPNRCYCRNLANWTVQVSARALYTQNSVAAWATMYFAQ